MNFFPQEMIFFPPKFNCKKLNASLQHKQIRVTHSTNGENSYCIILLFQEMIAFDRARYNHMEMICN